MIKLFPLLLGAVLLGGCAAMESREVMGERGITPKEAAGDPERFQQTTLEWGGVIVNARNLADSTELQILAYPLEDNGKPDVDGTPTGRFIAVKSGFLETKEYANGRRVTLSGKLAGTREEKVGEADYTFPLIQANEIQLWSREVERTGRSSVHFGIGIGSGGFSSGGVGIGIGL